jgi:hypothetical protein
VKKLAVVLVALATLLSGCVVYDPAYRDGRHRGDRDGQPNRSHDRDRDGVPDRQDTRPNNPNRY